MSKIHCFFCKHVRLDLSDVEGKDWIALECGNPSSPYHKCLVNVEKSGKTVSRITWNGCDEGCAGSNPANVRPIVGAKDCSYHTITVPASLRKRVMRKKASLVPVSRNMRKKELVGASA